MKKLVVIGMAFFTLSATVLTSCGKYEEGPGIALSSKKARLEGTWSLTGQTTNGVADDLTGLTTTMTIDKAGTYATHVAYSYLGFNYTDDFTGTWAFSDDKLSLITTVTGQSGSNTATIVRLANKELKLKEVNGTETVIYTYTAQ
ncbi:MAG: hypothetical protein RLZZ301_576 [Bacteroidota bacterium]|jgi:hypothetical protein